MAVGLFNRGSAAGDRQGRLEDLKLAGAQPVRDLWRQKDLGTSAEAFEATVPPHGAVLVKIGTPRHRRSLPFSPSPAGRGSG